MRAKFFSKRRPDAEVSLKISVRQRIWYALIDYDPSSGTIIYDVLPDLLLREYGWTKLRGRTDEGWVDVDIQGFILRGSPKCVLDAVELFYDQLQKCRDARPHEFQQRINTIFEEANLPWRLVEGRILKIDSKWLEAEIHSKAQELLAAQGFEGALAEFLQARADLDSGDPKDAMRQAYLALESTMKAVLGIDREKPGTLLRRLIDSGIIPEYYDGFLTSFEKILHSVMAARNFEKGVGHGQGPDLNEPPHSVAELTVNLTGVLILYLLKHYAEQAREEEPLEEVMFDPFADDDIPF